MNISRRLSGILCGIFTLCFAPVAKAQYFGTPSPEIVSAWKLNAEDLVVVFRYDGTFFLVDGEPAHPGLEHGTFQWDKETGAFSVNIITDTNDDAGFSHPGAATTITISGGTLNYTVAGEGTFPFTRVVNTASAIVGSWIIPGAKISVTFLADGTYYLSEEANDPPHAVTGIEKGSYSWNSTTKQLSSTPVIDTNGSADVNGIWNVTGNSLTYNDGEDITEMFRVVTNTTPIRLPDFGTIRFGNYRQSSNSDPVPRTVGDLSPYSADAFVHSGVGASAPTVKVGSSDPISIDSDGDGGFEIEEEFATLTALNSFLPASTAIQFKDGSATANITSASALTFPSVPKIILRNGDSWNGGVYQLGENQVLQWSMPAGFIASQYITVLEVYDPVTNTNFVDAVFQGEVTHFDLTGKLPPGGQYEVELEFYRIDASTTAGSGVFAGKQGHILSASSTIFNIQSDSPAPTVEFVILEKFSIHRQTAANTVILDPSPVTPTNGGPFGFALSVQGQNMFSLPAPNVTPPPGTPSSITDPFHNTLFFDADDELAWRYGPDANDWGDLTQAAIDARFPNGTYTFLVDGTSVPLSLTGNSYPNIPQLTLTGGSWINGKYAVDGTNTVTVTTNTFTGYGSNVDGLVELYAGGKEVMNFFNTSPSANSAFVNLLANEIPSNDITEVEANFAAIVNKSAALPSAFSAAVYSRSVNLEIHTLPKIVSQSNSQIVQPSASVNLEITASGSPLVKGGGMLYQWRKNGVILPDATTPTLGLFAGSADIAGTYTCMVSNAVGSETTRPIILEYADAYQAYVAGFSLNSATSGAPDGDFDNDGIDNLLEFILGGSPTANNANILKIATTTPAPGGRNLVFSYDRKTVANGITQVIETSPSLSGIWTPSVHGVNGVVIATATLDPDTQRVTATIPSTETRLFVRLKATR